MPDSESAKTSDVTPSGRTPSTVRPDSTAHPENNIVPNVTHDVRPQTGSEPLSDEPFQGSSPQPDHPSPLEKVAPLPRGWQRQGVVGAIALSLIPLTLLGIITLNSLPDRSSLAAEGTAMGLGSRFVMLWLISMGATGFGVGLFMTHWSHRILGAIAAMTQAVRSLQPDEGILDLTPMDRLGLQELEDLADSLTQLAEQIHRLRQERQQQNRALQAMSDELEDRISQRTAQLRSVISQLKQEIWERKQTEGQLQQSQAKLIHSEKMSSLGQMVAGIAHEINNPVNFIHGNLKHVERSVQDILVVLDLYQTLYPDPPPELEAIVEDFDLEFLEKDLRKMVTSMRIGTDRILGIVRSLRTFSRLDQVKFKPVDLHEGIESTLLILKHRLKARPQRPQILVVKQYTPDLPLVECHAGQINQVFMNIITNALDALDEAGELCLQKSEPPMLIISTQMVGEQSVAIQIADNGPGIPPETQSRLFDPFFTTKPVGKGTGLGMSISYTIVTETHGGSLQLVSSSGKGASFLIELPIRQKPMT
ncbi:MAG: ATP-binding protein [Leptolyngbyaceae bacterium]|nr:ATP-binding protein [Leptolyngbyaceae bacterium]